MVYALHVFGHIFVPYSKQLQMVLFIALAIVLVFRFKTKVGKAVHNAITSVVVVGLFLGATNLGTKWVTNYVPFYATIPIGVIAGGLIGIFFSPIKNWLNDLRWKPDV